MISSAISLFNPSTNFLVIPEVDVDGTTFFNDVTLKLDFATGTFKVIGFTDKPDTISATPINTGTEDDIKMDFMGCKRSGRNEISCLMKITALSGKDRKLSIFLTVDTSGSLKSTRLFDNLGNPYNVSEINIGISSSSSSNFRIIQDLIAGIPTLVKFKFKDISPNASNISIFAPSFQDLASGTLFTGDFRDIKF